MALISLIIPIKPLFLVTLKIVITLVILIIFKILIIRIKMTQKTLILVKSQRTLVTFITRLLHESKKIVYLYNAVNLVERLTLTYVVTLNTLKAL